MLTQHEIYNNLKIGLIHGLEINISAEQQRVRSETVIIPGFEFLNDKYLLGLGDLSIKNIKKYYATAVYDYLNNHSYDSRIVYRWVYNQKLEINYYKNKDIQWI